ncbi:MAG: amidohydrolase family protein [Planctomycetia bacterium]|nr:MAG: hypothetical protein EDS66_07625 [Planctomycetota bacterium]KAB2949321.1 MAG: amidohydrolase family protein [Phycisphaerae bacterium]MBE7455323.1 amidohydrolase family protein [Planctomycetia bacterium]MCK6464135.1 amidohydrolase family protein [Phycisphaerae bacterium]MCQ3919737.1 hypothetical protein [Planctomycetota bacterium]
MRMRMRMRQRGFAVCAVCIVAVPATGIAAGQVGNDEKFVVVRAGRVITVSGEEYAPGMIVIADGKVRLVGQNLEYPDGATVIDARGQTVMPGMIHVRTRFGLPSYNRPGVRGDLKALDEVVLSQIEFEELLEAGFTAVCYTPFGDGIAGVAGVLRTGGAESARRVKDAAYLRVDMTDPASDKGTLRNALKKAQEEIDKVEKARQEWEKKQKEKAEAEKKQQEEQQKKEGEEPKPGDKPAPSPPKPEEKPQPPKPSPPKPGDPGAAPPVEAPKEGEKKEPEQFVPPAMDPAHLPLIDLIQKKYDVPLFIELDQASDYLHAEDVLKPHKEFPRVYWLGARLPNRASDYDYVVKALGEKKALVVVPPAIYYLPLTVEQYNLAAELTKAGCKVACAPWWDAPLEFDRVRSRLADLVRGGLARADALKSVTAHAAEAAGVADRLGTIEKDRDADLVFLSGDPLDPRSEVTQVMIGGEIVYERKDGRR